MYAISLTSIPPRYPALGPVLSRLLAQRPAPDRVILVLPAHPSRFPPRSPPEVPEGVETWRVPRDEGPATKALPAARALTGHIDRVIYCDDDWLMPPGWAAALLAATGDTRAAAASGFGLDRLRRRPRAAFGHADIAQGFAGVCIRPEWLAGPGCTPPPAAWAVDDIWLSAQLARQGIGIRLAPEARKGLRPAYDDAHALQDATIGGLGRAAANHACLDAITARYGLWPPVP